MTHSTDCVTHGAALLDKHIPGWHQLVDPATLSMSSWNNCVLGQITRARYGAASYGHDGWSRVDAARLVRDHFGWRYRHLRHWRRFDRLLDEGGFCGPTRRAWIAEIQTRRQRDAAQLDALQTLLAPEEVVHA